MRQPSLQRPLGSNQCRWLQGIGMPEAIGVGGIRDGTLGTHPGAIARGVLRGMESHQQQVPGALGRLMQILEPLEFEQQLRCQVAGQQQHLTVQMRAMHQLEKIVPMTLGSRQLRIEGTSGSGIGMMITTLVGGGLRTDRGHGKMRLGEEAGPGVTNMLPSLIILTRLAGLVGVIDASGHWRWGDGTRVRTCQCIVEEKKFFAALGGRCRLTSSTLVKLF